MYILVFIVTTWRRKKCLKFGKVISFYYFFGKTNFAEEDEANIAHHKSEKNVFQDGEK